MKLIYVWDKEFKTPEGYTIENSYASIRESIVNELYLSGFVYEVTLKSGWVANFYNDLLFETDKLSDSSTIQYFTMRAPE